MNEYVKEGERIDDLQRNHWKILQNPKKFCFGMDAVLLSSFAVVRPREKVLDLGTGTGVLPLLLAAKTEGEHFIGLEIQPDVADMAFRSVLMNGAQDRVEILTGDLREASRIFGRASFDVVISNPPYMKPECGKVSSEESQSIARYEVLCTLEDVIREAAACLRPGGRFYLVHRPHRLTEIFRHLAVCGLEPKRLRLVHTYSDREAKMVLLEASRGGGSFLKVDPPLIIYEKSGVYAEEVRQIYENEEE